MTPAREYAHWNVRSSDNEELVEPRKKYVFVCEGANTEQWYFEELISIRKELNFGSMVEIVCWEKTGEDSHLSAPLRLIDFAVESSKKRHLKFDSKLDQLVVIFDVDRFVGKDEAFQKIIARGREKNVVLGVTNPNFELFLLLHFRGSLESEILPNATKLLAKKKKKAPHLSSKLFQRFSGMNSKKNKRIGELARQLDVAVEQEKKINQDIDGCLDKLTSNIGKILETIRREGTV